MLYNYIPICSYICVLCTSTCMTLSKLFTVLNDGKWFAFVPSLATVFSVLKGFPLWRGSVATHSFEHLFTELSAMKAFSQRRVLKVAHVKLCMLKYVDINWPLTCASTWSSPNLMRTASLCSKRQSHEHVQKKHPDVDWNIISLL